MSGGNPGQVSDPNSQDTTPTLGPARPQAQSESTGNSTGNQSTPFELNSMTARPIANQEDEAKAGEAPTASEDDRRERQETRRRLFEVNARPFVPIASAGIGASVSISAADRDRARAERKVRQKDEINEELARNLDRIAKQEQDAHRRAAERMKALDREARQVQFEDEEDKDEYL
jgi:hypothetical protein